MNIYDLEFCKRNIGTNTWNEEISGKGAMNRADAEKETNISRSPSRFTRSQQNSSTYDVNEANIRMKSNNPNATQAQNMNGESRGRKTSVSVERGRERKKSLSPSRYLRSQHTSPTAEINVHTESDDQRATESSRKDSDTQNQRSEFQLGGKVGDRADAIMQKGVANRYPYERELKMISSPHGNLFRPGAHQSSKAAFGKSAFARIKFAFRQSIFASTETKSILVCFMPIVQ